MRTLLIITCLLFHSSEADFSEAVREKSKKLIETTKNTFTPFSIQDQYELQTMYMEYARTYGSLIGQYDPKSSRKKLKLDKLLEKYKNYLKRIRDNKKKMRM